MSAATLKPIRLECYLPRLSGANNVSLFRADSLASSSVVAMDKYIYIYTGCPRRNLSDFGIMFLKLKYTDITQNTYIYRDDNYHILYT
jgi:hypothetical protein